MKTLRKNIIYWFIIVSTVVVILEAYMFYLVYVVCPEIATINNVSQTILEVTAMFMGLAMLFVGAVFFNKKVKGFVEQEAARQVKERNVLFANIAHDLKNPISSVLGFARALEAGNVSEEEKDTVYKTICGKSIQMDEMIRKMFQYAKMESEGYALHRERVDLCKFLREMVAARYNDIEEAGMQLEMDVPDDQVACLLDETEFGRAINNLISNAIRHNQTGTAILVRLRQTDKIRIVIADTGEQIPEAIHDNVFEPFQCSDASRVSKDGSGLGLAISKRIVERHEGELILDERIKGFTKGFVIVLSECEIKK